MIRKTIPALLLAACLPSLVLAAPASTPPEHAALRGPGFGPESMPFMHGAGPMHGPKMHAGKCGPQGPHGASAMGGIKFTPEQNATMRKIVAEQAQADLKIKKKYFDKLSDADKKAMIDELKQNREEGMKKMRALLTPEQQKRMDERKQRQAERMKEWKEFQAWKAQKAATK